MRHHLWGLPLFATSLMKASQLCTTLARAAAAAQVETEASVHWEGESNGEARGEDRDGEWDG